MKYVYIDHSELVELKRPTKRDKEALEYVLGKKDQKILLSSWHIVEAAGCTDKEEAIRLGRFMESLNPHWLRDRINVQESEVKVEFYKERYSHNIQVEAIYPSFLQLIADFCVPSIGKHTTSYVIEKLKENPSFMKPIEDARDKDLTLSKFMQEAQAKGRITKGVNDEAVRRFIRQHLPERDLQGKFLTQGEKDDFIQQADSQHLPRYPSIYVEFLFSEFKRSDPRRRPKKQDVADCQHLVPGLTYANVFITRDGYLLDGARYVKKKACRPVADIYDSLASFAEADKRCSNCQRTTSL